MARDKLVTCKVCGAQIANSTKKCPQCGAKQKKGHGFRNFLLLVVIVVAAVLFIRKGGLQDLQRLRNSFSSSKTDISTTTKDTSNASKATQAPAVADSSAFVTKAPAVTNSSTDVAKVPETSEVDPDFKAFMDSYEAFVDEYCAFLKSYNASDLTMLAKYTSMISSTTDWEKKAEKYDEDDLNDAELKYYIEVNARIEKKLLDVAMYQ